MSRRFRTLPPPGWPPLDRPPAAHHVQAVLIDPIAPPSVVKVERCELQEGALVITLEKTVRKGASVRLSYPYAPNAGIVENASTEELP